MKQTFLHFGSQPKSYLPKFNSRRFGSAGVRAAYKSDGAPAPKDEYKDDPALSDEVNAIKRIGFQVDGFKNLLGEKANAEQFTSLEEQIKTLSEGIATMQADAISKAIAAINDANKDIHRQIAEMSEEAAKAKENSNGPATPGELVTTKDVEAFIAETFKDGKKTQNGAAIAIKAAETFGYPTFFTGAGGTVIDAFTGRYVDPKLYQRKRKRNLILDWFDIRTINVPKLIYLVKVEVGDSNSVSGDPGGAAWILSGQAKPKRSFRVTTGEAEAKKVSIFGTVEDKLLRDVASLQNWIREDFMDEMRESINDGLLNNNPAINALAPLGLKTNAIQYTASPAYDETIEDPNYIDEIIAAIALMAYNKEEAGMVFISSDVYHRILHLKATDGKWLNNNLVYINALNELYIAGVHVVWADEEDVPSTHILVIGRDLGFKIYAYGNMVFERGLNGEDFREDKTSFRGYQEFLSFIPENRENSVLYDTFANIEAAITAAPEI